MSMKNPLRPSGIEPVTFRFVAQQLNHCATAVPNNNKCKPGKLNCFFLFLLATLLAIRLCDADGKLMNKNVAVQCSDNKRRILKYSQQFLSLSTSPTTNPRTFLLLAATRINIPYSTLSCASRAALPTSRLSAQQTACLRSSNIPVARVPAPVLGSFNVLQAF